MFNFIKFYEFTHSTLSRSICKNTIPQNLPSNVSNRMIHVDFLYIAFPQRLLQLLGGGVFVLSHCLT